MKRVIHRGQDENHQSDRYDVIVGADFHIREDVPVCRTDDYLEAQFAKMEFIRNLCAANECPLLVAGDLFDHWKPSPYLLSRCLELLPAKILAVCGQHDLPQHSLSEIARTGINTLVQAERVTLLGEGRSSLIGLSTSVYARILGLSYGEKPRGNEKEGQILVMHRLVCALKQPWPGADAVRAADLLKEFPTARLIVTGDNHQQFIVREKSGGRAVLNPGSMMRMTVDQEDFEPAVYGICWGKGTIDRIPLPIKAGVVSRSHMPFETKETRDERMHAYIERAKSHFESKLSFEENMKAHIRSAALPDRVAKLIWQAMEEQQ